MIVISCTPAYGRRIATREAFETQFNKNLDFKMFRVEGHRWVGGPYFNKKNVEHMARAHGVPVTVRLTDITARFNDDLIVGVD